MHAYGAKNACVAYIYLLKGNMQTADHYLIARVALEYSNEIINPVANDKWRA